MEVRPAVFRELEHPEEGERGGAFPCCRRADAVLLGLRPTVQQPRSQAIPRALEGFEGAVRFVGLRLPIPREIPFGRNEVLDINREGQKFEWPPCVEIGRASCKERAKISL